MARPTKTHDPFRWYDSSPEVIRLVVMMYVGSVKATPNTYFRPGSPTGIALLSLQFSELFRRENAPKMRSTSVP